MMNRGFDDILDACLDRITQKGDSIEQCLESYPEQAGELEPLLRAALSVKDVSSIEPRTEFQRMAKARLLSAVAAKKEKEGRRRLPLWSWQQRWAVALAVVLALVMMGGGTVAASTNSLPGDVLYPVKTTTERVQAFFTFGKEAKANLCMRFAERRIVEIEALAERERNIPESVLSVMNAETDRAIALANQNGSFNKETIARLIRLTAAQKMMLARMGEVASLEVKLRFQEALRRAVDAYGRAVVLRDRIHKWQNMEVVPAPNESLPLEDEVMIQPG
ncbi:MAG: DUF5667 domain-containing protein, partial [Dehalococcoidia bacterium]